MRVALATALFANPDLLLLDEPTNHLDLEGDAVAGGLARPFPGAALVVSHDRGLLDRAVDAIAHLDRGKIALTPGGFDEFVRIRTERAMQQARAAEADRAPSGRISSPSSTAFAPRRPRRGRRRPGSRRSRDCRRSRR